MNHPSFGEAKACNGVFIMFLKLLNTKNNDCSDKLPEYAVFSTFKISYIKTYNVSFIQNRKNVNKQN